MATFESREDCPPVEDFIWGKLAFDYGGYFGGIRQLTRGELRQLRSLCDQQLANTEPADATEAE